ncbi:hypothetical protein KEM55_000613 [Ascosphaera atra]|nr:hypothetical protein KEM55_000613 [Ascosphaera atra]
MTLGAYGVKLTAPPPVNKELCAILYIEDGMGTIMQQLQSLATKTEKTMRETEGNARKTEENTRESVEYLADIKKMFEMQVETMAEWRAQKDREAEKEGHKDNEEKQPDEEETRAEGHQQVDVEEEKGSMGS